MAMSSVPTILAFFFTVITSIGIVAVIILLGWFLIWKAFLSKFRLVRELLGQANGEEAPVQAQAVDNNQGDIRTAAQLRARKVRRD